MPLRHAGLILVDGGGGVDSKGGADVLPAGETGEPRFETSMSDGELRVEKSPPSVYSAFYWKIWQNI
jgi:hypothetical protein